MKHSFVTYFDGGYLDRGLSLIASFRAHVPEHALWVLALDAACAQALRTHVPNVIHIVELETLESAHPELLIVKASRSRIEYYFTLTPIWTRYVLNQSRDDAWVHYLDADGFFFSSPRPFLQSLADWHIALTPHRFRSPTQRLLARGTFNVGWVGFRNSPSGLRALDWWSARCLEWCFDRVESSPMRYADQGYLDAMANAFEGVLQVDHAGVNAAPWNIDRYTVSGSDAGPQLEAWPLIYYHFHGLRKADKHRYDPGTAPYGARLTDAALDCIYRPYLAALESQPAALTPHLQRALSNRPAWQQWAIRMVRFYRLRREALLGRLISR